jgi:hypothetical protein
MDTRTVVKFGKQGRFHLIVATKPGTSIVGTACGAVRDTAKHTTQGMVAEVPAGELCADCMAKAAQVKAEVAHKAAAKVNAALPAYLAETVAAAAERVGWWDSADMLKIEAAARLGAWS